MFVFHEAGAPADLTTTPVVMGPRVRGDDAWIKRAKPNSAQFPQFVFATRAVVMNCVASSMAVPSGVGITIRNGTRMRVPATGAKAISMLRWAARYLITGRSGM